MKPSSLKVVIALYLTTFLAAIEGTIVSTAMPIIMDNLEGAELYSWVNTIYLLAMVVATPLYGKLSDIYGRKLLISIGIIIFIIGSALSGIAWNMSSLIVFRAIQGLGGASLLTLPMVIITDLFQDQQRYKIQGWLSSIWGVAGILGPLTGGLLVDYVSWRSIFYLNVPFALIALVLIYKFLPNHFAKTISRIDVKGISTFSIGILLLLYGLNGFVEHDDISAKWLYGILMFIALICLYTFVRVEKNANDPFIPLEIFTNKMFRFTLISGFVLSAITVAIIFYIPLWMQHVKGFSATGSGLIMIPLSITWPLGSILAGQFAFRYGMRKMGLIGSIFLLLGSGAMATITVDTSPILIMIYILISGMSFGVLLSSFSFLASAVASEKVRGAGLSAVQLFRSLGQAVGLVLFGMLLYSQTKSPQYVSLLEISLRQIFGAIAIISLLLVIYITWALRNKELLASYNFAGEPKTTKVKQGAQVSADRS
ncbi:MDR family MFS transporter [Paenibacillus endoradicis]|uniref:MDR family MFS transporter n=1 Tax=Paenibacillus endoradicis TaxID=2972487 RepID=UPI002159282D|nr:MDR family MFS transporter [Paenibacillus endoradicis]MCR8656391.1 MFS transporter [Paenibacillus endoradicis]